MEADNYMPEQKTMVDAKTAAFISMLETDMVALWIEFKPRIYAAKLEMMFSWPMYGARHHIGSPATLVH